MKWKTFSLKTRLCIASVAILAAGFLLAAVVYVTVPIPEDEGDSYIIANGVAYPVDPAQSKTYVHELRQFGGKAAVLIVEINRWFAGLWRGRALARTIAWISLAVSFALFLFARSLPAGPPPEARPGADEAER